MLSFIILSYYSPESISCFLCKIEWYILKCTFTLKARRVSSQISFISWPCSQWLGSLLSENSRFQVLVLDVAWPVPLNQNYICGAEYSTYLLSALIPSFITCVSEDVDAREIETFPIYYLNYTCFIPHPLLLHWNFPLLRYQNANDTLQAMNEKITSTPAWVVI